jgi:hypothetical protein
LAIVQGSPATTMNWTELCGLASERPMRCQLVLDHALTALAESRDASLQATITAETPTLEGLCAALDAHAVAVPSGVVAHVSGRRDNLAPPTPNSMPQDVPTKVSPAL